MKRLLIWVGVAWAAVAFGASNQSPGDIQAEALQLKMKIESGAGLSDSEIQRALEITRETGDQFDMRRAKPGAPNVPQHERPRHPGSPLDEYIWAPVNYEWVDIGDVGTNTGLTNDDQFSGPYDLGFDFTFYGQPYTQVWVCSNGWVCFVQNGFPTYFNTVIPDPAEPNTAVYGFWDDLYLPSGGQVLYYQDAVNDRFIVTWEAVPHIGTTNELYTFQIVLTSDGNIRYNYNSIFEGGTYGNLSCTVGAENQDGTEAVQMCFDGTGSLPVSESSVLIGQPDGVPGPVTNLTAQNVGEDVVFNWINPTEDTNGNPITLTNIQVWLGLPANGILLGTVAGTATTFTELIAPDGNHTYSVRPYANPYYGPLTSVNLIVGNPSYVEDFEVSDGLWTAPQGGWEWGDITNPGLFGAHSGSKGWAVGLTSNYVDNSCYYLDLDVGLAVTSPTATVEFWVSWSTESWWDGCNFKVSTDDGNSWELITPDNGYEQPALSTANACIPGEPGWSNFGVNWHYVVLPIGQYQGEAPIFRFSFGSDPSVTYPGFAFDDMIIWGLAPPVGAPVSGTVTLDGGAGAITAVNVHANGLGNPLTHPAANGTYTLDNVLVGNRVVWADLAGYHDDSENIVLTESGMTGLNLTLVRLDPPAPTGLTASVDNDNGLVTLDWANSTDPLVDNYNLYRKLQDDANWTLVGNVVPSNATHQLPADGVYLMAVSALDVNVSTPVESDLSNEVTILYGSIPPTGLNANGNFDDRIRLSWFAPGTPPEFELSYDDGANDVQGIAWWGGVPTFGWLVAKYVGTGLVSVTRIKTFFTGFATLGSTYEVGVFADNGGVPSLTPLGVINSTQDGPLDDWTEIVLDSPISFPDGIFYIGARQIDAPISIGGDNTNPFVNNTFFYNYDATAWVPYEPNLLSIPMQRCFAIGNFGAEVEMRPGEVEITNLPFEIAEVRGTEWTKAIASGKFQHGSKSGSATKSLDFSKPVPTYVAPFGIPSVSAELTREDMNDHLARAHTAVLEHAPNATPVCERDPDNSLDDLDYYVVYRGGSDIAHPTATTYDDLGRTENVDYVYTVAAHYDNGEVSSLAGPVTAHCNMAPAFPTNLAGVPQGNTHMRLTWSNPTQNADGTPLVDQAGTRVFRNGTQISQVGAGITEYIDTPPDPQQLYTWTVVTIDEVPNLSAASAPFQGFVVSPWEIVDFNWIDIGDVGENTGLTGDDETIGPFDIGFDFPYLGETHNQVWVCSNGWMTFTETFSATYSNGPIPDQFDPSNALYVFWDDMYLPSGGQVLYHSDPTNGQFVVSWISVDHYFQTGEIYTYQIVLTTDGAVYFNYETIPTGGANGNISCTVGVENATSSDGIQVCYDGVGDFLPESGTSIAFWAGPSGEINGTVREFSTNTPIQNAEVSVEGGDDVVTTDVGGVYILGIEPGTYTLIIHKQGFCDESFPNIVVVDEGTVTQNASMHQPNVQFNVTSLNMIAAINQNTSTSFEISNPTTSTICPVEYSITDNAAWLSCTPATGTVANGGTQIITVSANVQGLPFGDYNAVINIVHNDNGSPSTIPVTLSISLEGDEGITIPTEFAFHQNYPNPFNATTSLLFDLPSESRVDIAIFNVMGQEVDHPVNEIYPAGSHAVSYTADELPSGMYLVRMSAGSFSALNKMVLLK